MSISKEVIKPYLISKQREEFKNLFFIGFKFLISLRLSALCEKFFFVQDTLRAFLLFNKKLAFLEIIHYICTI